MRHRIDLPADLLTVAGAQDGVISVSQVRDAEFPLKSVDRLVHQRHWVRLLPGIYRVAPGEPSWSANAWAGVLYGGDRARLGFEAAGHLWNLIEQPPTTLTVLVPNDRQLAARAPWVFRRETVATRDQRSPGSPPRTTVEDTVVDLSSEARPAEVVDLVTKAVQGRRTTAPRLLTAVDRRSWLVHRALLQDLLSDVAEGAQSVLELRYQHDVEQAHGLPRATRQARSRRGAAYRDARYDEYATIVELDGLNHLTQVLRDARRDNAALLDGEVTLRFGWPDVVDRPCLVAWQVATVLRARGWRGFPTRCERCRGAEDADLDGW